jgi:hypothetical protein
MGQSRLQSTDLEAPMHEIMNMNNYLSGSESTSHME